MPGTGHNSRKTCPLLSKTPCVHASAENGAQMACGYRDTKVSSQEPWTH